MSRRAPQYVSVAPGVPLSFQGRQVFSYRAPAAPKLKKGSAVTIPFGKRRTSGVVTAVLAAAPTMAAKPATPVPDTTLTDKQMQFAQWLAQTMRGGLGFTLRLFLPPKLSGLPTPLVFPGTAPKAKKKAEFPQALEALALPTLAVVDTPPARRQRLRRLVESVLASSRGQVLIIVPEKHMLEAWKPYPTMHAASPGRYLSALWRGALAGSLRVVVGTQKALFLPFKNLRLIVIDEEQLSTHKLWDAYPRLDNRDAVRKLAALHGATVLFSASFPSLSLHEAIEHDRVPVLLNRPPQLSLSLYPLTGSDRQQRNLLPLMFIDTVKNWLRKKHHVLLLLNRTGPEPESVRRLLKHTFGAASHNLTLATSAIFTTEDRPRFHRAAWLFPEYTFTYPDFRSAEHGLITLARLSQLLPAKESVAVITRNLLLAHQLESLDWPQWYALLLAERKSLDLPPFRDAILLTVSGRQARAVRRQALKTREILENRLKEREVSARLQGPFQSLSAKPSAQTSEYHLLLLGQAGKLSPLYQDLPVDRAELSPSRIL